MRTIDQRDLHTLIAICHAVNLTIAVSLCRDKDYIYAKNDKRKIEKVAHSVKFAGLHLMVQKVGNTEVKLSVALNTECNRELPYTWE